MFHGNVCSDQWPPQGHKAISSQSIDTKHQVSGGVITEGEGEDYSGLHCPYTNT